MRSRFHAWISWIGRLLPLLPLLLLLLLQPGFAQAASLTSGPSIEFPTRDTAVVIWSTDVATRGRVQWGLQTNTLQSRAEGPVTNRHAVVLSGIVEGQRYQFTVGTARKTLATNTFVAGSSPTSAIPGPHAPAPAAVVPAEPSPGDRAGAAPLLARPPPTRETWGNLATLTDHFERHGGDFGARDADDYAAQAWQLLQRARREKLPVKQDSDGVLRVYDPGTRAFGAYNRNGTTRTFFKPRSRDYFNRQPGRVITLPPSPPASRQ